MLFQIEFFISNSENRYNDFCVAWPLKRRRHIRITIRRLASSSCVIVVGVTKNFCHTFPRNHRGQLPDIWHRAWVWRTVLCTAFLNLRDVHFLFDAICLQDNFCHIFLGNQRGQLPDIWHRASVWRTVSCNAVLKICGMSTSFFSRLWIGDTCLPWKFQICFNKLNSL